MSITQSSANAPEPTAPEAAGRSTLDDLRAIALALPGAYEDLHLGGPAWRVKNRKFALWWAREGRLIMRLDPAHQEWLFEVRPATFQACPVGRVNWSFVVLDHIDRRELRMLVLEAWAGVADRAARAEVCAAVAQACQESEGKSQPS